MCQKKVSNEEFVCMMEGDDTLFLDGKYTSRAQLEKDLQTEISEDQAVIIYKLVPVAKAVMPTEMIVTPIK